MGTVFHGESEDTNLLIFWNSWGVQKPYSGATYHNFELNHHRKIFHKKHNRYYHLNLLGLNIGVADHLMQMQTVEKQDYVW